MGDTADGVRHLVMKLLGDSLEVIAIEGGREGEHRVEDRIIGVGVHTVSIAQAVPNTPLRGSGWWRQDLDAVFGGDRDDPGDIGGHRRGEHQVLGRIAEVAEELFAAAW